jgi:RHS repeat-associated protein
LGLIGRISGNTRTYAHQDGLGSTRLITSSNGNVAGTTQYDAFGTMRSSSGTQYRFGFTGEQLDGETGFVYLRARYLDPSQGRFLTKDPFAGVIADPASRHRYAYVSSDPMNRVDPSGLCPADEDYCDNYDFPYFVDIGENINRAESLGEVTFSEAFAAFGYSDSVYYGALAIFVGLVRPEGAWDYKNNWNEQGLVGPVLPPLGFGRGQAAWENFGNFHFGIVAAAFGFSLDESLGGAAFAQSVDDALTGKGFGYGDNPADPPWIAEGWQWYQQCW